MTDPDRQHAFHDMAAHCAGQDADRPGRHPLLDRLSRPRSLMVIAGATALCAIGAATFAFGRGDRSLDKGPGGPTLQLTLVAPVEPTIEPGERMEVGALTNEFDGRVPASPTRADDPVMDHPAYVESSWGSDDDDRPPSRATRVNVSSRGEPIPPPPRDPPPMYRADAHAFGFDQPGPDYQAQRQARRAVMEARMEAERRNARRYSSSAPPANDPDADFY